MVDINERFLKFSRLKRDFIPIENDLDLDSEIVITITAQVISKIDETNNDGTVDRIYVVKGLLAEPKEI